jgi:hypothetical protein
VCFYNSGAGGWVRTDVGFKTWEEGLKAGFDTKQEKHEKHMEKIKVAVEEAKADLLVKPQMRFALNHPQIDIEDKDYIVPWAYARYAYVDTNIQGKDCCGYCVSVYWPSESKFFTGNVESYDESTGKHKIVYEDGDEEIVELSKVIFHYWRRSPDFNWIAQQSGKKKKKKVVVKEKVVAKNERNSEEFDGISLFVMRVTVSKMLLRVVSWCLFEVFSP